MNAPHPISGFAFPAGSSLKVAAQLMLSAEHATLVGADGEVFVRAPRTALVIDPALGRAPRKITWPDGAVFETDDHAGISLLEGRTAWARLHRLERFGPHLVAFAVGCMVFAWLLWRYGLDILASAAIAVTPPAVIDQIDVSTLQIIDFTMAEPSTLDAQAQARARAIYERVVAAVPADDLARHDFALEFRAMEDAGPNAFALPGGTMVLTDALITQFPDEDVIAAILGHEIAHVTEYHGLHRLYRSLGSYILIALLAGDTGPMLEDLLLEGQALLALSFSRAQESEADEIGLRIAFDAGYDPAGLKQFFEALGDDDDGPESWFSTHPANADRIRDIDRVIEGLR